MDGRHRPPRRRDAAHRYAHRAVRAGGHRRPDPLPRGPRLGRQLLLADAAAAPQRLLGGRRAADHTHADAHVENGRARARPGAHARAHGAVPGPATAPVGSGRLSLGLRRSAGGRIAATGRLEMPAWDLLVRGGTLVDPAQSISARRDVAFRGGKVAAVAETLTGEATEVIDAAGAPVPPRLIDNHTPAHPGPAPRRHPPPTSLPTRATPGGGAGRPGGRAPP